MEGRIAFSRQTRASRVRAVLKLMLSVLLGRIRCIIIGKKPRKLRIG